MLDKPTSFTHQWLWVDEVFDGYMAVDRIDKIFVTDPRTPPLGRLASISNRTQQVILLGYAEGQGPYPKPWEKHYWRLAGRGVGPSRSRTGRCAASGGSGAWTRSPTPRPKPGSTSGSPANAGCPPKAPSPPAESLAMARGVVEG